MLVTWYGPTGSPMANGSLPSNGDAACGYDLPLGSRVVIPNVGTFICEDRIGYDPWRHVDVFNVPLATGVRLVTVYS